MWIKFKRVLLLLVVIVTTSLPIFGVFISPTYATSSNFTAASSFNVTYNTVTSTWSSVPRGYVGCVNACNDTKYGMGIRFTGVTIPNGSTITSAYLTVVSSGSYWNDTVNSLVRGEDADSAAVFTTVANYQARVGTTAYTAWNGIAHWSPAIEYASSDISSIITEITSRAGWVSGNNMVLFWDDHNASSSQSCSSTIIRGGNTFKLVVNYTAPPATTPPGVTTKDTTSIGSTTGILNAYVDDDGGDIHDVAVRFGYDIVTHAANFAAYTTTTAWLSSNYSSGTLASLPITGLTPGVTYFYNVQAQNDGGTVTGVEQTFVTPAVVTTLAPSNFVLLPSSSSIDLQWSRPSGFSTSIVRWKSGAIPADNTSGYEIYNGVNEYYTHSSLTSGSTYGYRVWGYENGVWSASTYGIVTTKGTSTGTGLTQPPVPTNWFDPFITSDYTKMNTTFFYPIVNNIADSLQMPRNTAWVTWALLVSMFAGFLAWSASRSMVALTICIIGGIAVGWMQGILPFYMAFLIGVFGISIIVVRERL